MKNVVMKRGYSSVGRASGSQCEGQGFDSPQLHDSLPQSYFDLGFFDTARIRDTLSIRTPRSFVHQSSSDTTEKNTPTARRSFFKRHRILSALLAIVLLICIVIVSNSLALRIVVKRGNAEYVSAEQWMETVEGTAEFTGIRASQVTGYDFGPMYFDNTKDVSFSDVVPFYQDGQLDESFLRNHLPYKSGSEIALMLRALDDEASWQSFLSEQTADSPRTLIDAVSMVLG